MGAVRYRRLHEQLIVADRADHLAIDVDAVLTEHRLRRNRAGTGRLLKQEIDCALLRGHTLNLTDDRRRGQRTDHSERTATFGSTSAGAERPFMGQTQRAVYV